MAIERRRVFFAGRVQGVGFRLTTRQLAQGRPVAGLVRNLADGRVELVVEGEPPALDDLLAAVSRTFATHLHDVAQHREPPGEPPLVGFAIG